jgi:ATP/maltotriose-dependent transcriptional regulator MalT
LLQPAAALESEPRLRDLRERIGDPLLAAYVDLVRAKAFTANGRLDEAQLVLQAHAGRPMPDNPALDAVREVVTADLAFAKGALDAGSRYVRSALSSTWYSPDSGIAAYARWRLLEARQALGDEQGVAKAAAAADVQSRARPDELTVDLYASLARAEAAEAQGDTFHARTEFERALAQAETIRVPFDLVHVVASYTRFLLKHGQTTEAGVVAERIAGWAERDYTASLVQLGLYHATGSKAWRPALSRTRRLAGERVIPAALAQPPSPTARSLDGRELASVRLP